LIAHRNGKRAVRRRHATKTQAGQNRGRQKRKSGTSATSSPSAEMSE
jgi:hypothetical protein